MQQITFKIEGGEDVVAYALEGENLLEVARKVNVAIDAPCSGNGSCGKCRVRLASGNLVCPPNRHISDEESKEGWILACEAAVGSEDIVIEVPDIASAYRSRMKIADLSDKREAEIFENIKNSIFSTGIGMGTGLKKIYVELIPPSLDDPMADIERVGNAIEEKTGTPVKLEYFALKKLPNIIRESDFSFCCLIKQEEGCSVLLDLWDEHDDHPIFGLAMDIGTTTVSAVIVDIETGEIISKASSGNGQVRYGADIINRIVEATKKGGLEKLQKAVIEETIIPIIDTMCVSTEIRNEWIYTVCITANTTMNHLLLGIYPDYIRKEPYVPTFMELTGIKASDISINTYPGADIILAPNIGSYVGGDITAGTLSSMMWNDSEFSLFIDLGTNGEIVFGNCDFLVGCACSAGPAFEGGDISCGMRATDGAIESVQIDSETLEPTFGIIGPKGQKPIGLCGSGLIDCVAEMARAGIINPAGKIIADGKRIKQSEHGTKSYVLAFREDTGGTKDIELTEIDLDNFIRAKGAIFSAIKTMLEALDFDLNVISRVIIAGGIGSGINIDNSIRIGMLPDINRKCYTYIGNSSLAGAYAMLISDEASQKVMELARNMTYMDLSSNPYYMDEFVSACFIPHTNMEYFPSLREEIENETRKPQSSDIQPGKQRG
ncbi:MAG: DUF4445 domain-containing protein [Clostridiales bacterium]|jgi:uncharacterized 2Fe-2S/4Fe-4S cluster protein (DUF4445 family)|nr:DUF4445 domain-containing protein [Clostridiales bacterium]